MCPRKFALVVFVLALILGLGAVTYKNGIAKSQGCSCVECDCGPECQCK